ncbi:hypothetical protein [Lacinutrix chionoecetis]
MPLGESMITVIRNNNLLRRAKSHLEHQFFVTKKKDTSGFNLPKATPELLEKIRLEIKVEQQKQTIKTLMAFLALLLVLILIIL